MRPRCRVCGSRRCLTPLEREKARATKLLLLSAVDRFRQGLALKRAEERLAAALRLVLEFQHNESCARAEHAECGLVCTGEWRCWEGMTREECEAVPCDCGLAELEAALRGAP